MPKYYFEYAKIDDLKGDDRVYGSMDSGYNRRYLKSCDIVADSVEEAEHIFMKDHPECEILRQETYVDDSVEQEKEENELTICPVCGEERFNDTIGLCVDCGYDENAWGSFDESLEDRNIVVEWKNLDGVTSYKTFKTKEDAKDFYNEIKAQRSLVIDKDSIRIVRVNNLTSYHIGEEDGDSELVEGKQDGRLSPTSYKYKGYRISLDHKIGAYSVFDKQGEMEDHGYLSKEAAENFVDSLVSKSMLNAVKTYVIYYRDSNNNYKVIKALGTHEAEAINAAEEQVRKDSDGKVEIEAVDKIRILVNEETETINEETKVLRIRGKEYPIRDKSFLTDDKIASINNEYGLECIFNVRTPDGKRYKIYDSGFGNLGHSDACAILAEDYTTGGYVHTSIEYKGEHIIPSKYKPGKYFVSINRVGGAPQKKFFSSVDEAKSWIDSLNEALPALAVGAITAAATGFGQGLGDKLGTKLFGEDVEETEWSEKEINDFLVSRSKNFTVADDVIKTYYKNEKDTAVQILKKHYKLVDVSDGRHSEDDEMVYVIAYAEPLK